MKKYNYIQDVNPCYKLAEHKTEVDHLTLLVCVALPDGTPLHDPYTVKSFGNSFPSDVEINQEIELNDWTRWNKHPLLKGQKVEISENIYYDLLNCVPPRRSRSNYFEVGEAEHHDEKGKAVHRACWIESGKYFTGYPF